MQARGGPMEAIPREFAEPDPGILIPPVIPVGDGSRGLGPGAGGARTRTSPGGARCGAGWRTRRSRFTPAAGPGGGGTRGLGLATGWPSTLRGSTRAPPAGRSPIGPRGWSGSRGRSWRRWSRWGWRRSCRRPGGGARRGRGRSRRVAWSRSEDIDRGKGTLLGHHAGAFTDPRREATCGHDAAQNPCAGAAWAASRSRHQTLLHSDKCGCEAGESTHGLRLKGQSSTVGRSRFPEKSNRPFAGLSARTRSAPRDAASRTAGWALKANGAPDPVGGR